MVFRFTTRKSGRRRESGAVLLEFAFLLPVLIALMLGTTTGGITLWHKITIDDASREAARYGATLPVEGNLQVWLSDIAAVAVGSASGVLDAGQPARTICVAYVSPGSDLSDRTMRFVLDEEDSWSYEVGEDCFTDGRPSGERRVQVQLQRESRFEAGFFGNDVDLLAEATARYERFES